MNKGLAFFAGAIIGMAAGYWLCGGSFHSAKDPQINGEENKVFASFSGGQVLGKEILGPISGEINAQLRAISDLKKQATIEKVQDKLLNLEAKQKNLTPDQLLAEVRAQAQKQPPSAEELSKYITNQGLKENKLTKEQKENIAHTLQNSLSLGATRKYLQELYQAASPVLNIP